MKLLEVLQGLDYEVLKGTQIQRSGRSRTIRERYSREICFSVSLVRYQMDIHMQRMWLRRGQP